MITEVGKRSVVHTYFLRSFLKRTASSQRHNFMLSCAIHHNQLQGGPLSRFQKTSISNTQKFLKSFFSSQESEDSVKAIDKITFENVCSETLDSLAEYFEELVETIPCFKSADVTYSDGVLTVHLGKTHGTYVINRQTPNFQIWLSSPTSGPKRYDYIGGTWIYKHDKTTLHSLLDKEIKEIANKEVQFINKCLHSKASTEP